MSMTAEQWQRVKTIVQQTLEIEAGERKQFVAERCASDPAVRTEVEALLGANETVGYFIETPACFELVETLPMEKRPDELAPGQMLRQYEVIEESGRGGMATVYLAYDRELGRNVALKVLSSGLSHLGDSADRFRREARAASALNHPNILTIHEIGSIDSVDFIATEYIDGITLRQRMAKGPLPLEDALAVAAQVSAALAEAHAAGIVHRDIKPENVMIRQDGLVKVLDFGIAKLAGGEDLQTRTAAGSAMNGSLQAGTPKYMSPEQLRGAIVDARTDVWSLGIVIGEMLTGEIPVEGEWNGERKLISNVTHSAGREIRRIIDKCVQRDPDLRYSSAAGLLRDLKQLQTARVGSQDQTSTSRLGMYAGAMVVLLAMVASLIYAIAWQGIGRMPEIRNLAVLPVVGVGDGSGTPDYFVDGLTEALITELSQIGDVRVISRSSVMRYKSERSLPQIAQELDVEAIAEVGVQRAGNIIRLSVSLTHAPSGRRLWEQSYERDITDIRPLLQAISRDLATATNIKLTPEALEQLSNSSPVDPEAYEEYLKGRYHLNNRNESAIKTAIGHFNDAIARDPNFALPHAFLSDAYFALGTYHLSAIPAPEALRLGEAAALRSVELGDSMAETHTALGVIRLYSWQWAEAEREFKRALDLNPNYGAAHSWYALYFASQGRNGEAIARMYRARELDPLSPHINQNVGWMLQNARQYDEAIEQHRRALELDPNFLFARRRLSAAYESKQMYEEAVAEYEKVIAMSNRNPSAIGALGATYAAAGRKEDARKILNELLETAKVRYVPAYSFAEIYSALGDRETAFRYLEKAYEEHSYAMVFLKVSTDFNEEFRRDARFLAILKRLGVA